MAAAVLSCEPSRPTGVSADPTAATQPCAAPLFEARQSVQYVTAAGESRPATVSRAHTDDPAGGIYYTVSLDGVERQTPQSRLRAAVQPAAHVGCGPGSETRTLLVAGNFEGDGERLEVVLQQAQPVAQAAHARGNVVTLAFLGNLVPDVQASEQDPLSSAVRMSRDGARLGSAALIPANVVLLAGQRELAWLRLVNVDPATREIARADSAGAALALRTMTPFSGLEGIDALPGWAAHEAGVAALPASPSAKVLAVGMALKLVSMARLTLSAPGLVDGFVRRLRRRAEAAPLQHDLVSVAGLEAFLADSDASIGEGLERLVDGDDLTPDGLLVLPAAKALVASVLDYAEGVASDYLRSSVLVERVVSGDSDAAVWLTPRGFADARDAGRLPVGFSKRTLQVERKDAEASPEEWARGMNGAFRSFVARFTAGKVDREQLGTYLALSLESPECTLPVCGLAGAGGDAASPVLGVSASAGAPFGTICRRILTDPKLAGRRDGSELVGTLEKWAAVNTDAFAPSVFFAIATWCSATKRAIDAPAPRLSREKDAHVLLHDASVTLATMLASPAGDGLVRDLGIDKLDGLVGPLVQPAQDGQQQPMRMVSFTHAEVERVFVVLLPEKFVKIALGHRNFRFERGERGPTLAVQGFVALPDGAAVPLLLSKEYSPAEDADARARLGTRLWALPSKRPLSSPFTAADYRALEAMKASPAPPAALVAPGFTLLHVRTSDNDALSGLHVSIARVPDLARVTLVTDTNPMHSVFNVSAR